MLTSRPQYRSLVKFIFARSAQTLKPCADAFRAVVVVVVVVVAAADRQTEQSRAGADSQIRSFAVLVPVPA